MSAILCRGLCKRYGTVITLDLTVPEGSIFGFLGSNGAGKSTAIRILATLSHPTAGDASIAGMSVTEHADRVRRMLGYLPQEPAFRAGCPRGSSWNSLPRSARCRPASGAPAPPMRSTWSAWAPPPDDASAASPAV